MSSYIDPSFSSRRIRNQFFRFPSCSSDRRHRRRRLFRHGRRGPHRALAGPTAARRRRPLAAAARPEIHRANQPAGRRTLLFQRSRKGQHGAAARDLDRLQRVVPDAHAESDDQQVCRGGGQEGARAQTQFLHSCVRNDMQIDERETCVDSVSSGCVCWDFLCVRVHRQFFLTFCLHRHFVCTPHSISESPRRWNESSYTDHASSQAYEITKMCGNARWSYMRFLLSDYNLRYIWANTYSRV